MNVLFLCTGNSARSILAEALLNHRGAGRFVAYSAGSNPRGEVHPIALELLAQMNLPTAGLHSKSWAEFTLAGAPNFDFIFTVCANAAGESCPIWPGHPLIAHWGIADPATVEGSNGQKWSAFRKAFNEMDARIKTFLSLPIQSLTLEQLKARLQEIGDASAAPLR